VKFLLEAKIFFPARVLKMNGFIEGEDRTQATLFSEYIQEMVRSGT